MTLNTNPTVSKLALASIFALFLIGGNAEAIEVVADADTSNLPATAKIVGSSCRNFIFQPSPTQEKALADLLKVAAAKGATKISAPDCKATPHAGIGLSCGTYWSQVVCEAVILE